MNPMMVPGFHSTMVTHFNIIMKHFGVRITLNQFTDDLEPNTNVGLHAEINDFRFKDCIHLWCYTNKNAEIEYIVFEPQMKVFGNEYYSKKGAMALVIAGVMASIYPALLGNDISSYNSSWNYLQGKVFDAYSPYNNDESIVIDKKAKIGFHLKHDDERGSITLRTIYEK